ncbi:hypothetical protein HYC85_023185 [Camellia sinensis]|uniref:ABC transporter domain-containing protein n=1 Tax=Camellia sinensis TaxID=4442 RepID=A0A7J7GHQ7_CAMSI|nr:hypothetical protein HYC85_023185 [Camellia sinensis]
MSLNLSPNPSLLSHLFLSLSLSKPMYHNMWNSSATMFARTGENGGCDDEEALRWAALQRSPTYVQARTSFFRNIAGEISVVDVGNLEVQEKTLVLDKLVSAVNDDIELFFNRIKRRFNAVHLEFPKVEVRFQDLLTLLLGPPSSGKTTFLLSLAGRPGPGLQMSGRITYNGHDLKEFVPQRTSAYVSQQDWHMAEMTVRETLEFSGRCQGVGFKHDMLSELLKREKQNRVIPDEELDIFIKALALGEQKTLVVEYIMKILGLDICEDTLVGDDMLKGISGGQKKRLTTGELLVGPSRVLFMDEISTGLDSSTTHQIIKYLRYATHALDETTVVSLLQPDPETYELFDDIILLSEGQIVYQGPREAALEFFTHMGFQCPDRKNVADFLQEVLSEKDQEQYWFLDSHYQYIPVARFAEAFQSFCVGSALSQDLAVPYDRRYNHPAALSTSTYGVKRTELLKISFSWQMLLMKRNSFVYIFKFVQLLLIVVIMMTVFFRTTMHHDTLVDGGIYLGALYFAMVMILFNGFMEVPMLIAKLPVLYKHRDLLFYPCWVYTLPSWVLSIPASLVESAIWVAATYYVVGFDPQITRCFKQFMLYFFLHQMSIALFRVMASLGRNMIVANTFGSFALLVVMALGGFILSRDSIPSWWIWGYWFSPLMYAQNAASVNEFLGHSWDKTAGKYTALNLGEMLLKARSLFPESYWFWIGVGALLGYTILFNILFTLALTYLNPLGNHQAVVSKEKLQRKAKKTVSECIIELQEYLQHSHSYTGDIRRKRGMVLPFQPLSMTFNNLSYYVDVPVELKKQGVIVDRLQLLVNITGAFRPGVLTALVGVSGAGKTTLMDVLAGRKTGGTIEGTIHISGYPKKQETFARIAGYCEQNDIHSPCLTVRESLIFSALLRLPSHVDSRTQKEFVDEIMKLVELTPLSEALVGLPGVDGLSTEQRKRLTIAVELVANPSIVFMDEPTSGLDARSAAIVMRTVRNIVNTGRTIVCTIHQPSIDIFESFDELLLMKRGGKLIYAGPLGTQSSKLIQFFEAVQGVPKIRYGYNPATWILEISSPAEETRLGVDFAEVYQKSIPSVSLEAKPVILEESTVHCCTLLLHGTTSRISSMQWDPCIQQYYSWESQTPRPYNPLYMLKERAAGMYSALTFAFAQVVIEFPYVLVQSVIYSAIFYFMASFEWSPLKFVWYLYFMYFTLLYFTFFGMMTISVTPNHNVAAILAAPFYMMWNLFSGFMIPRMNFSPIQRIPIWWRWYYWANPIAWSLYGLLTSQYGEMEEKLKLSDGSQSMPIKQFLKDQFGYKYEFLDFAAIAVADSILKRLV